MATSLTRELLGARLRQAREARGLNQQQVAEYLGFKNHQPVLRMESGQREVRTMELEKLASLYRRPLSFFVTVEEPASERTDYVVLFRAGGLIERNLTEVDRVVKRCEEIAFLARALDLAPGTAASARLEYSDPTDREQATAQGERVAADARRVLGLDENEPIIDLADLLQDKGIGVFAAVLPDNVSGLCVGSARTGRCIITNATERAGSDVFTVAHEFCHLLLDDTAHICYREEERDLKEVRADQFAGALLMPAVALEIRRRDHLGVDWRSLNPVHVVELQFHFKVSYQAVLVRLRKLRLITEAQFNRLDGVPRDQLARLAGDEEQEARRPAAIERRLRTLAVEAYRRGLISRGRLAEILEIGFDDLTELLKGLGIEPPAIPRHLKAANPLLADEI